MRNILYIDDSKPNRYIASEYFKDSIFTITCVDSAACGLEELDKNNYDLVISDLLMPNMNGMEFAKEMMTRGITTPLILTSAADMLSSFDEYKGLKNYLGFIIKPLTPDKVTQIISMRGVA